MAFDSGRSLYISAEYINQSLRAGLEEDRQLIERMSQESGDSLDDMGRRAGSAGDALDDTAAAAGRTTTSIGALAAQAGAFVAVIGAGLIGNAIRQGFADYRETERSLRVTEETLGRIGATAAEIVRVRQELAQMASLPGTPDRGELVGIFNDLLTQTGHWEASLAGVQTVLDVAAGRGTSFAQAMGTVAEAIRGNLQPAADFSEELNTLIQRGGSALEIYQQLQREFEGGRDRVEQPGFFGMLWQSLRRGMEPAAAGISGAYQWASQQYTGRFGATSFGRVPLVGDTFEINASEIPDGTSLYPYTPRFGSVYQGDYPVGDRTAAAGPSDLDLRAAAMAGSLGRVRPDTSLRGSMAFVGPPSPFGIGPERTFMEGLSGQAGMMGLDDDVMAGAERARNALLRRTRDQIEETKQTAQELKGILTDAFEGAAISGEEMARRVRAALLRELAEFAAGSLINNIFGAGTVGTGIFGRIFGGGGNSNSGLTGIDNAQARASAYGSLR